MQTPKTYEVNTPRLLVKYLSGLVAQVNANTALLSPQKAKVEKAQAKSDAKEKAKLEARARAEFKAQAKENAIAEAKAIVAAAEAMARAEAKLKKQVEIEAARLEAAKKLLKESKFRKILITILIMFIANLCFGAGGTYPIRHRNVANPKILTRLLQDRIGTLDDEVTALEASQNGIFSNIGTGSVFYVDSSAAAGGAGTTWATAFDTLQEGIDAATDLRGDIVYVAQDHTENINNASALNVNCPGLTIVGIGNNESKPEIVFITDTTAELTISAADVCIYNMRFISNIGDCATGVLVTADGDGAQILGCEFRETSNILELLIMITAAANADELVIVGNRFIGTDSADPTNAILLEGASSKTIIQGNHFIGTWSASVIDGTTAASTGLMITDNDIVNVDATAGMTIRLHTNTGGALINNHCYANGAGFAFVGDEMFVSPDNVAMNTENVETRNYETMFGPYRGDAAGTAGDSVFADFVLIDALLDLIIADFTDYDLDHISSAADGTGTFPASVTDDSVLAMIMTMGDGGAANISDYDFDTMSLEALNVDTDAILVGNASLIATIAAMDDNGYAASCTSNPANTSQAACTTLAGFGDDYFNTGWSLICILDASGAGSAPEGEIIDIIDYDSGTGLFTVNYAFSSQLTTGDGIMLKRTEELNLDDKTILGCAGTIRYVDSGASGDATGLTLENASLTIAAAEALCGAGDVVYIADGHDEEIGDILINNAANISFIGLGEGDARPLLTCNDSTDEITLDEAGITIKNIRMQAGADKCTYAIRVEDAGIGCTLENISFIDAEGANEEFEICVDVDTSASKLTVKNCTYANYQATAADVDTFVDLTEATISDCSIIGCTVFGTFAVAPVSWAAQIPTNLLIQDNVISNTTASAYCIYGTGNATGMCINNRLYSDDYATMLDPGYLKCSGNIGADAIDQQGIAMPISAETSDVTEVAAGSNLERLEWLQKQADDIAAKLGIDSSVDNVWYVDDSATGGADGTSFLDAEVTLQAGINDATDNTAAYIFIAENHDETLGAAVNVDCPGITIIGLGNGDARPTFIFNTNTDSMTHTVADVTWKNCIFTPSTQDCTVAVSLDGSSDNVTFEDCEWRNATTNEFVDMVTLASGTDDARFIRCRFINTTAVGGCVSAITNTSGVCDGMVIEDCYFYGTFTTAAIEGDQADTAVRIINNTIYNYSTGDYAVSWTSNTSFGEFTNNRLYADTVATILDPGGLKCFGNLATDAIDEGGIPIPTSQDTTVVTAAADGSPLERLELIQQMLTGLTSVGSNPLMGTQVSRAKEDIFDGAAGHVIFRVATGRVLVTTLTFLVEDGALDATANNVQLRSNPTTGTEADLCAVLNTANDEEGTIYSITGTRGDALVGVDASSVTTMITPMIIAVGDIELDSSGDNAVTNSATISSELWYFPLDDGATVSAP